MGFWDESLWDSYSMKFKLRDSVTALQNDTGVRAGEAKLQNATKVLVSVVRLQNEFTLNSGCTPEARPLLCKAPSCRPV